MAPVPARKVIYSEPQSRCQPIASEGGTGFLCSRGPRPVLDILDCGHVKVSYNGKRPTRKCDECQPGDPPRKAVISQDGKRLIVVIADTVEGWVVEVSSATEEDDPVVEPFTTEGGARAYANDLWAGRA